MPYAFLLGVLLGAGAALGGFYDTYSEYRTGYRLVSEQLNQLQQENHALRQQLAAREAGIRRMYE